MITGKRMTTALGAVATAVCAGALCATAPAAVATPAAAAAAHATTAGASSAQPSAAASSWRCREATATTKGARVSAAICWQGHTAKVAGQIYDTLADHRSACVQISKGYSGNWNICDHKGANSSIHFVTGEFGYQEPVNIEACAENRWDPAICSGWH